MIDQSEDVDSDLYFEATMSLLKISNKKNKDTVEAIVVRGIVDEVLHLWTEVLSVEEKYLFKAYLMSEKPLYFIKNKLSASQVSEILKELTKENCPFREKIPSYIILPMETIAATANLVTWMGATSPKNWLPDLSVRPKKEKRLEKPPIRVSVVEERTRGQGIDMFPIPSGKAEKPRGLTIGVSKKQTRINFKVHGDTPIRRLQTIVWPY